MLFRKVWEHQSDIEKTYMEEGDIIQWPKETVQTQIEKSYTEIEYLKQIDEQWLL